MCLESSLIGHFVGDERPSDFAQVEKAAYLLGKKTITIPHNSNDVETVQMVQQAFESGTIVKWKNAEIQQDDGIVDSFISMHHHGCNDTQIDASLDFPAKHLLFGLFVTLQDDCMFPYINLTYVHQMSASHEFSLEKCKTVLEFLPLKSAGRLSTQLCKWAEIMRNHDSFCSMFSVLSMSSVKVALTSEMGKGRLHSQSESDEASFLSTALKKCCKNLLKLKMGVYDPLDHCSFIFWFSVLKHFQMDHGVRRKIKMNLIKF
jgi:hypothetical protein